MGQEDGRRLSGLLAVVLAERARSECARSMRARAASRPPSLLGKENKGKVNEVAEIVTVLPQREYSPRPKAHKSADSGVPLPWSRVAGKEDEEARVAVGTLAQRRASAGGAKGRLRWAHALSILENYEQDLGVDRSDQNAGGRVSAAFGSLLCAAETGAAV